MTKNTQHRLTQLQGRMAVASFVSGVVIATICIFFVEPPGEISTSALSFASELLVLAGGLLGMKVSFDAKLQHFQTQILDAERRAGTAAEDKSEKEEGDEL